MLTFSCIKCGHTINVPDTMLGENITCITCQTPQIVPKNAPLAPDFPKVVQAPVTPDAFDLLPRPHFAPFYPMARLTSVLMGSGGAICTILGLVTLFEKRANNAGYILITGLIALTLAQILDLARTIARQTYRDPNR